MEQQHVPEVLVGGHDEQRDDQMLRTESERSEAPERPGEPRKRRDAHYRKAALRVGYPEPDPDRRRAEWAAQLGWLELRRLGCIAHSADPALRRAWLELLDPREDMAIRYLVAVQAVEHGVATEEPRQALRALARGSGDYALDAQSALDDWDRGYPPSL